MIAWWRICKTLPAFFDEYGLYQIIPKQWVGVWAPSCPLPPSPAPPPATFKFFRFFNLLLENKLSPLRILQNCVTLLQDFHAIFFDKVPWLSPAFWDSSSLSFPKMNYNVHTFFLSLNSTSLNKIQGENVHNFKEILLMMYVYRKTAFIFEVSFSTSTYGAKRMCLNFTHILMNIFRSIDLHKSLQTFSIRIVWQ